jgi:hypothetical protein
MLKPSWCSILFTTNVQIDFFMKDVPMDLFLAREPSIHRYEAVPMKAGL